LEYFLSNIFCKKKSKISEEKSMPTVSGAARRDYSAILSSIKNHVGPHVPKFDSKHSSALLLCSPGRSGVVRVTPALILEAKLFL
jgi:hypothetical protein